MEATGSRASSTPGAMARQILVRAPNGVTVELNGKACVAAGEFLPQNLVSAGQGPYLLAREKA